MTPRQVDQLLDWAKSGGTCWWWPKRCGMEETAKKRRPAARPPAYPADLERRIRATRSGTQTEKPDLTKLYVDNETAPAYFSFDTDFNLTDPKHLAQFSANSARSSHLMQLNLGQGRVTVVTDSDLWKPGNRPTR